MLCVEQLECNNRIEHADLTQDSLSKPLDTVHIFTVAVPVLFLGM